MGGDPGALAQFRPRILRRCGHDPMDEFRRSFQVVQGNAKS
jgi:hypothetical protein